jgi:peptide methionine sulfoxide reductase MsrA
MGMKGMKKAVFGAGCCWGGEAFPQGSDDGSHDRAVRFAHSADQKAKGRAKPGALKRAERLGVPILAASEPFGNFSRAKQDQQRSFAQNGLASCHLKLPQP